MVDRMQHGKRAITLLLALLLPAWAGINWQWQTYTNAIDTRQIIAGDSTIWCATNGGLLRYNPAAGTFAPFVNTDGLAGNDITAVTRDHLGRIWVAIDNGAMNVYHPATQTWRLIQDYAGQTINRLTPLGDSIFVALGIGVSLFDAKRWEVKETYKIGEIHDTHFVGRQIWAAGPKGVYASSLDLPNLMAPNSWVRYTASQGLLADEVRALQWFENRLYAGTTKGINYFENGAWSSGEFKNRVISDLEIWQGKMVIATNEGVFWHKATDDNRRMGPSLSNPVSLTVDTAGQLWAGLDNKGIALYNSSEQTWDNIIPEGPADNKFTALTFDHNGDLWTASSSAGISRFDGAHWQVFNLANKKLPGNDYRCLAVDSKNRVWAGSWGGGIAIFTRQGDSIAVSTLSAKDGLAGISVNPNYIVITALHADEHGNMWILNYQADNLQVLAVVDTLMNWQYFSTRDGIKSSLLLALEIDNTGRKWIGTQGSGVSVLDDNNTPFNKSDDDLSQGLGREDGLLGLTIRSLAHDRDGVMWIGTPDALHYWYDGAVKPRYQVINDDINVIAVDVRNNKWIGTSGGMSMFEADGFTWHHFSTSLSPLVSDNVTSFAFDQNTGEVYIGTTNGLSRLQTPFTRPAKNLDNLSGYPNPFIIDGSGTSFYIDGLAENAAVRIFTPEGRLVRNIPAAQIYGARIVWDGRTDRGEYVASGIYLYLVTTTSGMSKAGKVAIIRQ